MASPETASPPPYAAATSSPPPPQSIPISQQTQSPINPIDSNHTNSQSPINSPPETTMSPPQPPPEKTLIELQNISAALSSFQTSFNSLQLNLNTLKFAVDNLIANNQSQVSKIETLSQSKPTQMAKIDALPQSKPNLGKESITHFDELVNDGNSNGVEVLERSEGVLDRELRVCCETMNGRGLKRYLVLNLKDIVALRVQVPNALKFAPNVGKLVLECSGRFFLQGSKAYVKGSPMVTGREASVLILECFILMEGGGDESRIDAEVKEEAYSAAMLWRKRIIGEGGILKACEIDARGLLLLIGCFGVPQMFKDDDLRDLLRSSNVREMAGTLRKSNALMAKVPEIIEGMIQKQLEVDAIDVAYTFGFEERFNVQTILTSLFQKFKEPVKKGKKFSQPLPASTNEANRKQLAELKSLVKCLEGHNIDASIISRFEVREKILSLKKDISEYDKKSGAEKAQKRKAEEAEAGRRSKFQEGKRSRYTGQGLQQQKVGYNSQRNLLDTGMGGHINGYSVSQSMLHGQVAGTGYAAAGAYGGMVVDPSGHLVNHSVQPYGWHTDPALTERVVTHSYAAQPSSSSLSSLYRPSSEGYVMLPSGSSIAPPSRGSAADLYQFADTVVDNEYHPPVVPSDHTSYLY